MMLRVVLKWFAHWVSYSAYAGLKCWVHGKWVGSRLAQRCVGGQSSHNMARIAGYCAGIGALEWAREGRLRVPGALRGALCALLATWCVLVKDDMAWVICAACCRGAHSRFEREASVGCRGLRCVWCVCGARASSRRRGLKRWGRVCGRHATHKYLSLRRLFSGLTVIIIEQEETTTTSDPSTATLLHIRLPRQNSASTDSSHAGERSPGVPGFGHARVP